MPSICAAHQVAEVREMNIEYKGYIIQMNNIIQSSSEAMITSLCYFKNVLLLISIYYVIWGGKKQYGRNMYKSDHQRMEAKICNNLN
jgi:hypothetical protein